MKVPFVDLGTQYQSIKEEIDLAIQSVINQTSFIGGGIVKEFEADFATYVGVNHCIGCANGTDAIEIALQALGIGNGDEVIVPALTWISTAGSVNNVGAEPVFVDVTESERTIDTSQIESKITPKTKAIIAVHLYGLPARMNEILTIANKHGLEVIEDCAQAHGASIGGQTVGTFGKIATFSFYPGKNLGAYGDAGAITTRDEGLAVKCRMIANHGQMAKHDHRMIGRNSRLDTLQAAILKTKLQQVERWTSLRIENAHKYSEALIEVEKPITPDSYKHVFHLYVIQSKQRDQLKDHLKSENIGCAIHYPHPLPFTGSYNYKNHQRGEFPVAEKLCSEILSLPMYAELSEEQINTVTIKVNNEA